MYTLIAAAATAAQLYYVAAMPTFGCNSSGEVAELLAKRAEPEAFQQLLYTQIAYGQCIAIDQGAVVPGVVEESEPTLLRIYAEQQPPGFMVPASDFEPQAADAQP